MADEIANLKINLINAQHHCGEPVDLAQLKTLIESLKEDPRAAKGTKLLTEIEGKIQ
jgi:hypothetical protein